MSRNRKFQMGDVAGWYKKIEGALTRDYMYYFTIIVDYRQDGTGRGMYRVVRTLHPVNGATYGEPVWVGPHDLARIYVPSRMTAVSIYRANEKLEERGCLCMCCAHEAIPKGQIRADGTFRHEHEEE